MKTLGKVWLFYDAEKQMQSKAMSIVQAQVFLLSLKRSDHLRYFIWTPGWTEWTCIRDFLKSEQKFFATTRPPKPSEATVTAAMPTQGTDEPTAVIVDDELSENTVHTRVMVADPASKKVDYGYYHNDFTGDDLDLSKIRKVKSPGPRKVYSKKDKEPKPEERRGSVRHSFKIEVVLVSKFKSFRTFSVDISLSGTQLEDEIPNDFLQNPFDLIIVNPYEKDSSKSRLLFRAKIVGDMSDPRRLMFIEQDKEMTLKLDALLKAYVAYQKHLRKNAG